MTAHVRRRSARPHPRGPRLPEAGHPLLRHHHAAQAAGRVPRGDRPDGRAGGRHADRPRGRHGVARLHLQRAAGLQARRRLRAGAQARQAAGRDDRGRVRARVRHGHARDPLRCDPARAARADRRRPARDRRDGDGHDRARAAAGRRDRGPLVHGRARPRCEGATSSASSRSTRCSATESSDGHRWRSRPRHASAPERSTDRGEIAAFLRRDRLYAAYALGDLDGAEPRPRRVGDGLRRRRATDRARDAPRGPRPAAAVPDGRAGRLPRDPRARPQAARRLPPGHRAARGGAARPVRARRADRDAADGRRPRDVRARSPGRPSG